MERLNIFLSETHHFSPMPGARFDYSANGGLLNLDGKIGMLEAKDMMSVLTVFPFAGMIIDGYLSLGAKGHFTQILTLCTIIAQKIYGKHVADDAYFPKGGMTKRELKVLRAQIRKFKPLALSFLESVENSGLDAHKMHLLDHVYDDLKRMGSFLVMAADAWEAAYKSLKSAFNATSKRNEFSLEETIAMMHTRACAEEDYSALRNSVDKSVSDATVGRLRGRALIRKTWRQFTPIPQYCGKAVQK